MHNTKLLRGSAKTSVVNMFSGMKSNANQRNISDFVQKQVRELENQWNSPRFNNITRPYRAIDVVKHRGTTGSEVKYASSIQAQKLFEILEHKFSQGAPVKTLGVTDPVQMTQLARCSNIEVAYVSGWACSSTMVASTNDVSPDFGDYPYHTVPNQVERIFKAQQHHDRKALLAHLENGEPLVDYLKPIIADADMGHGGITSVMKVAKLFAEKGAAAIHLEDQMHGAKRCGHLSGAVIVPTSTHITRLIATRLQWDIMGTHNVLIARTDSANAQLLSSSSDPRDHAYIKGITDPKITPLSDTLVFMEQKGATSTQLAEAETQWYHEHPLLTYDEAAQQQLTNKEFQTYLGKKEKRKVQIGRTYLSISEMRSICEEVAPNKTVLFDWDAPRTKEGYYLIKNDINVAIARTLEYAPYSDLVWLETKTPDLQEAQAFASKIHAVYPHTKLVYNLSPSFNWSKHGFTKQTTREFIDSLAKSGFVLQLISLAGIHSNAVSFWDLANQFQVDGMQAYVERVQIPERNTDCDVLTHQRWSGAEYVDSIMAVVQNGAGSKNLSTTGESNTEKQF